MMTSSFRCQNDIIYQNVITFVAAFWMNHHFVWYTKNGFKDTKTANHDRNHRLKWNQVWSHRFTITSFLRRDTIHKLSKTCKTKLLLAFGLLRISNFQYTYGRGAIFSKNKVRKYVYNRVSRNQTMHKWCNSKIFFSSDCISEGTFQFHPRSRWLSSESKGHKADQSTHWWW